MHHKALTTLQLRRECYTVYTVYRSKPVHEVHTEQERIVTELTQPLCTSLGSDPHARHSTMLYSMQEGALSPNSAEGLMKHGRASREAT